jgi:tRNA-Thr(GGU) m(6)t(6)A37 methyltransferase TsaA
MENLKIEYQAIGLIHSPFKTMEGTPIQPSRAKPAQGTVELFAEYTAGLSDLDGFSHIILLCHLHKSRPYRLKVMPFLDVKPRGLFATRAPNRPNPIGLSVVKLLGINDNILRIEGVDMLDQTPVLDIKPYVGEFDQRDDLRMGWLENARKDINAADSRFK